MINRTLARSSVFQQLYAYYHSDETHLERAEEALDLCLDSIQASYYFLLDIIPSLTDVQHELLQRKKTRFYNTEAEIAHHEHLVQNRLAEIIRSCDFLQDKLSDIDASWRDNDPLLKNLLSEITKSEVYQTYVERQTTDINIDVKFWIDILQKIVFKHAQVDEFLSDISIYWDNPCNVVEKVEIEELPNIDNLDEAMDELRNSPTYQSTGLSSSAIEVQKDFVLKTLRRIAKTENMHNVLMPQFKDEEDKDFPKLLLRSAIVHCDQYRDLIADALQNWESERLADADTIILQQGIAELLTFPTISASVTLNEYIDLAKVYSTTKSGSFVNGLLDAILKKLREENKTDK